MEVPEEKDEDGTTPMFYSKCLLSKKGSLYAIWVSASCFKRLKKPQITDTQIPSSVDTILREGLPTVRYRILAYLLLGVVRIYSRKVEYLLQDCHETLNDVNRFSVGKKVVPFKDIIHSSYSIIHPERYELDSFQLDIPDVTSRGNGVNVEEITLKEARRDEYRRDQFMERFSDKLPYEEVTFVGEQNCNTQTSFGNTLCSEGSAETPQKLSDNHKAFSVTCTPPDKVLSPQQREIDSEKNSAEHMKAFQQSQEKLREFAREECMDLDMICEADNELLNLINDYQVHVADRQDIDDLERAPLDKLDDHIVPEEREVPPAADKTPDSEVPDPKGGATQELLVVPTPAKKENIQRPGKRKCVIDAPTVLDNEVVKQAINDASYLVSKRRKVLHTIIDVWRSSHIPTLSKNFFKPLIPCNCVALELQCTDKKEKTKPSLLVLPKPIETTEDRNDELQDEMAPPTPTNSRVTIAPGTPVLCPVSARAFVTPGDGDSFEEGPFHSHENVMKESSMHQEGDSGLNLMDEVDADEGDSHEHQKKNGLSGRTRTVAKYLHRVIHEKKQQGEESILLLPILKHKTRAQNAKFFFEILVLTTGGLVNVVQERAYDNVLLQETPKMEETLARE